MYKWDESSAYRCVHVQFALSVIDICPTCDFLLITWHNPLKYVKWPFVVSFKCTLCWKEEAVTPDITCRNIWCCQCNRNDAYGHNAAIKPPAQGIRVSLCDSEVCVLHYVHEINHQVGCKKWLQMFLYISPFFAI